MGTEVEGDRIEDVHKFTLPAAAQAPLLEALTSSIEKLLAVSRAVKEADTSTEKAEGVPAEVMTAIKEAVAPLGSFAKSEDSKAPEAKPEKSEDDTADSKSDDKGDGESVDKSRSPKQEVAAFERTLGQLDNVLTGVRRALGLDDDEEPKGKSEAKKSAPPAEDDRLAAVAKALGGVTEILKQQGEQIASLKGSVGSRTSGQPEETKKAEKPESEFSWDLDLNRPVKKNESGKENWF